MAPTYPMQRSDPLSPPPALKALLSESPVWRVKIWDDNEAWLVTDFADQRHVLTSDAFSADATRAGYPHVSAANLARKTQSRTFGTMDNPEHEVRRRMLAHDFSAAKAESMRPLIQEIVDHHVDELLRMSPPADLLKHFALQIPSAVVCHLLGVPFAEHERFQALSIKVQDMRMTAEEMMATISALRQVLAETMAFKRREPADDLLSRLANDYVDKGLLSEEEALATAVLVLFGGHDTTAQMIALGTIALLIKPDQLELLRDSSAPDAIANAAEELLRYLTVPHLGRRRVAVRDTELHGQLIRAGEGVICANDIGNRDDSAFPDPDALDLKRPKARRHLAFGFGIHQCTGQSLARVELQVVYGTLYRRIPALALAEPVENLRFLSENAVYGVESLPVTW